MMPDKEKFPLATGEPDIGLCAHANLRKAMRVVSQAYDATLKPSGLRTTQFTLLAVLAGRGAVAMTKLADILVMDRTTLTRNLKPLTAKGWLDIGRDGDDRVRLVSITKAGRKAVTGATPLWRDAQNRVAREFGEARLSGMIGDLTALVEAVRAR